MSEKTSENPGENAVSVNPPDVESEPLRDGGRRELPLTTSLRLLFCSACEIGFAVPESLYLRRTHEGNPIYCPSGHANTIDENDMETAAALIRAMADAALLRAQLRRASERLAVLESAAAVHAKPTPEELVRRCRLLAERAEPSPHDYGRRLCRFCGKAVMGRTLYRHLLNSHPEDVGALPARAFD